MVGQADGGRRIRANKVSLYKAESGDSIGAQRLGLGPAICRSATYLCALKPTLEVLVPPVLAVIKVFISFNVFHFLYIVPAQMDISRFKYYSVRPSAAVLSNAFLSKT